VVNYLEASHIMLDVQAFWLRSSVVISPKLYFTERL